MTEADMYFQIAMALTTAATNIYGSYVKSKEGDHQAETERKKIELEMERVALEREKTRLAIETLQLEKQKADFEAERWRWTRDHAKNSEERKHAETKEREATQRAEQANVEAEKMTALLAVVNRLQKAVETDDRATVAEISKALVVRSP